MLFCIKLIRISIKVFSVESYSIVRVMLSRENYVSCTHNEPLRMSIQVNHDVFALSVVQRNFYLCTGFVIMTRKSFHTLFYDAINLFHALPQDTHNSTVIRP